MLRVSAIAEATSKTPAVQTHKGGCTFPQADAHADNTLGGDEENPRLRQEPAIP